MQLQKCQRDNIETEQLQLTSSFFSVSQRFRSTQMNPKVAAVIGSLAVVMAWEVASPVSAATVGYWRFEEASGNTPDVGGTAGLMTAFNGPGRSSLVPANPVPQTGAANTRSFLVDGQNDVFSTNGGVVYSQFTDDVSDPGAGEFTLETWVNVVDGQGFIAGKSFTSGGASADRGYQLVIDASGNNPNTYRVRGKVRTTVGGFYETDVQTLPSGITYGEWHHIALVRGIDTLDIYVDGIIGSNDHRTDLAGRDFRGRVPYTIGSGIVGGSAGNPAVFGSFGSGPEGRTLNGRIDEVRISNVALNPDQFLRAAQVPEPITASLLLIGGGLLTLARRRRQ